MREKSQTQHQKLEQEDSLPHKLTSPTSKEDNDSDSGSEAATTPCGTPELVRRQILEEEREKNNNTPPPIIITDKIEYFDDSVFTNITDIDARSTKHAKLESTVSVQESGKVVN
eukprot:9650484-Ditylum_brightwellii.AAC.1